MYVHNSTFGIKKIAHLRPFLDHFEAQITYGELHGLVKYSVSCIDELIIILLSYSTLSVYIAILMLES